MSIGTWFEDKIIQFPGGGLIVVIHGHRQFVTVRGRAIGAEKQISRRMAAILCQNVKNAIHKAHKRREQEVFG